jgi:hypothetical protein
MAARSECIWRCEAPAVIRRRLGGWLALSARRWLVVRDVAALNGPTPPRLPERRERRRPHPRFGTERHSIAH